MQCPKTTMSIEEACNAVDTEITGGTKFKIIVYSSWSGSKNESFPTDVVTAINNFVEQLSDKLSDRSVQIANFFEDKNKNFKLNSFIFKVHNCFLTPKQLLNKFKDIPATGQFDANDHYIIDVQDFEIVQGNDDQKIIVDIDSKSLNCEKCLMPKKQSTPRVLKNIANTSKVVKKRSVSSSLSKKSGHSSRRSSLTSCSTSSKSHCRTHKRRKSFSCSSSLTATSCSSGLSKRKFQCIKKSHLCGARRRRRGHCCRRHQRQQRERHRAKTSSSAYECSSDHSCENKSERKKTRKMSSKLKSGSLKRKERSYDRSYDDTSKSMSTTSTQSSSESSCSSNKRNRKRSRCSKKSRSLSKKRKSHSTTRDRSRNRSRSPFERKSLHNPKKNNDFFYSKYLDERNKGSSSGAQVKNETTEQLKQQLPQQPYSIMNIPMGAPVFMSPMAPHPNAMMPRMLYPEYMQASHPGFQGYGAPMPQMSPAPLFPYSNYPSTINNRNMYKMMRKKNNLGPKNLNKPSNDSKEDL